MSPLMELRALPPPTLAGNPRFASTIGNLPKLLGLYLVNKSLLPVLVVFCCPVACGNALSTWNKEKKKGREFGIRKRELFSFLRIAKFPWFSHFIDDLYI